MEITSFFSLFLGKVQTVFPFVIVSPETGPSKNGSYSSLLDAEGDDDVFVPPSPSKLSSSRPGTAQFVLPPIGRNSPEKSTDSTSSLSFKRYVLVGRIPCLLKCVRLFTFLFCRSWLPFSFESFKGASFSAASYCFLLADARARIASFTVIGAGSID